MGGLQSVGTLAPLPDPSPGPVPDWAETAGLAYERGSVGEDWGRNQANYESRISQKIFAELQKRNYHLEQYQRGLYARRAIGGAPLEIGRREAMWLALAAERARDPKFLQEYGDVRDEETLKAHAYGERKKELERIDPRLSRGPLTGQIAGSLGYGATLPENWIPIGPGAAAANMGGRAILTSLARGAATNAALTGLMEPGITADARRLGIEHGAPEILGDLAVAGGIGALAEGAGPTWRTIRAARAGTLLDRGLVDLADGIGTHVGLTPDENAAKNVLTRSADIAEANPFHGPAGAAEHVARLDNAMRAQLGDELVAGGAAHPPRPMMAGIAPLTRRSIIEFVQHDLEGGAAVARFSDADGGTTKYGIAQKYHPDVNVADLSAEQAAEIARRDYWHPEFDTVDARTAAVAFDAGYISNRKVADRILRESGGDFEKALQLYRDHLNHIADTVPGKAKFKRGWNNRVDKLARRLGAVGEAGPAAPVPEAFDQATAEAMTDKMRPTLPDDEQEARPAWLGDTEGPVLRTDQFGSMDEHRAAQQALEDELARDRGDAPERTPELVTAEARDPNAATPRPGEYGGADNPTPDMLANRFTKAPASVDEALARIDERVRRIVASAGGERFVVGAALDHGDHALMQAAEGAGVDLLDEAGKPRPAAAIATELADLDELGSTVLTEEVGTAAGRPDVVERAARQRPEILPHEYRAEAHTVEDRPIWAVTEDQLRDRILARRAGREPPELPPFRDASPPPGLEEMQQLAGWDDPNGQAAIDQIASLQHDLQMEAARRPRTPSEAAPPLPPLPEGEFDPLKYLDVLKAYVSTRGRSLDLKAIGKALNLSTEQAEKVLGALAKRPNSGLFVSRGKPAKYRRDMIRGETYRDGKRYPPKYRQVLVSEATPSRIMRLPRRDRPPDVIDFLRDRGGIRDDEGHDLFKGRGLGRYPGLISKRGMSADDAAQALWEAGYFHNLDASDPSQRADIAETLDLIEHGRGVFTKEDEERAAEYRAKLDNDARRGEARSTIKQALAQRIGGKVPKEDVEGIVDVYLSDETMAGDEFAAISEYYRQRAAETGRDLQNETDAREYDIDDPRDYEGDYGGPDEQAARGDGEGSQRPAGQPGDTQGSQAPSGDIGEARPPGGVEQADAFGVQPGDQRRALEQQMEGRMRAGAPQKAPGSEGGLFDTPDTTGGLFDEAAMRAAAATDTQKYRLGEDGPELTLGQIFDQLDANDKAVAALRACLSPGAAK